MENQPLIAARQEPRPPAEPQATKPRRKHLLDNPNRGRQCDGRLKLQMFAFAFVIMQRRCIRQFGEPTKQMTKEHIIGEIRRTANANGGVPLGWRRFEEETGIKYHDWYGKFWASWGDAVREAGFEPNRLNADRKSVV